MADVELVIKIPEELISKIDDENGKKNVQEENGIVWNVGADRGE